ncbi:MAG: class I SAM-dependent DNA methyltransferase [Flavobacteriales bacterium]|nr:class I SAM-dependent DNA methyltransferase [Flavobacteriales bacterium]MCB9193529.1 class I SAM-dependent DNA methyltransferase [Flavobacteriales bacterium]
MSSAAALQTFLTKWEVSGASERANAQSFLKELCDVLDVPQPDAAKPDPTANAYVFEKVVPSAEGTSNFIDLYKRGCFVLETKQGADAVEGEAPVSADGQARRKNMKRGHGMRGSRGWDTAMERARNQAERYARSLPPAEIPGGRPPFLLVVDVGHSIALYADWSRAGGHYAPFPDPASYRIGLRDLARSEVRERLRLVWTEPLALDPNRRSAKVTREVAQRLGRLAHSLEGRHTPEEVANFLMRCLFTMFSEDVDLLPHGSFTTLLGELKQRPKDLVPALESLWRDMDKGGYAAILHKTIPRFNGGLFAEPQALPLNTDQIQLLIEASTSDWKDVEPAIFGTLLERALDPRERHKLGAHYTPRAYVERLVQPTIMEPLRAEWANVQVAALQWAEQGKEDKAVAEVKAFLDRLAHIRVLDPACGSGNFLYVTLELLKRLEGEVLNTLHDLGQSQQKLEMENVTVTPANLLGIEVNPRAAAIADLVLWIGFLQWHIRTHGTVSSVPEPILRNHHNIECRDAVLDWDERKPMVDEEGKPVTRWDGRTTKPHPVTGQEVPDPEARVQAYTYTNPRPAQWPEADYIVGNPPFIGKHRMREALGDGYTEALRGAYANVPDSADFVMFWWDKAAELVREGKVKRFGFITTNSLRQTFNRKVVQQHLGQKKALSLAFAIPDHPWVDSADGAAVRVAMTVGVSGSQFGWLWRVNKEYDTAGEEAATVELVGDSGKLFADLTIGADVSSAARLLANSELSYPGVKVYGEGFILDEQRLAQIGSDAIAKAGSHIRSYVNGRDITQVSRAAQIIDFYGLGIEQVRSNHPELYQWLSLHVKPDRDVSREPKVKEFWWLHGRTRPELREAINGLDRYIATVETSKHRFFVFLDKSILPDNMLVNIALEDAYFLGVLSSHIHVTWALASGGTLEDRPRYNKTRCFDTFPFPAATEAQQARIRELGEQLDAHRKRQQAQHPELTMTGMYNVLERVRAGETLTAKDKTIYDQGLVGILKQLHDELDAAVAEAYGWPANLSDDEILYRLVALNAERAAEEAQGHIRWLRPEYQNPGASGKSVSGQLASDRQAEMDVEEDESPKPTTDQRPWPKELPAQAAALREVLTALPAPADVATIAGHFKGKRSPKRLKEMEALLETLEALGGARKENDSWISTL